MPQNFYELIWLFIIYAVLGWCVEVSYSALNKGVFINRGFLNGPYCPIYGLGMIIVIRALMPLKQSFIILFIGSFLLTTLLEFLTGFILEKIFHNKWWDYSDVPFNIKGYVCLKFSILWGLGCTFIINIIHPIIYKFMQLIPYKLGIILISSILIVFFADVWVTVSNILKLNKKIKTLEKMADAIHNLSDELGENIFEKVTTAIEKSEEFQEEREEFINRLNDKKAELQSNINEKHFELELKRAEKYAKLEAMKKEYEQALNQNLKQFKHILNAFPDMKSTDRDKALQEYKENFKRIFNKNNNKS